MYKSSRSSLIKVSRREGDYGSFVIVVSGDDVKETTLHFPFTHPQLAGTTINRSLAAHSAHQVAYPLVCLVGTACRMTALCRNTVIFGDADFVQKQEQ